MQIIIILFEPVACMSSDKHDEMTNTVLVSMSIRENVSDTTLSSLFHRILTLYMQPSVSWTIRRLRYGCGLAALLL